jgi:hypothetical protein
MNAYRKVGKFWVNASGGRMTDEQMKKLTDKVDHDKRAKDMHKSLTGRSVADAQKNVDRGMLQQVEQQAALEKRKREAAAKLRAKQQSKGGSGGGHYNANQPRDPDGKWT